MQPTTNSNARAARPDENAIETVRIPVIVLPDWLDDGP